MPTMTVRSILIELAQIYDVNFFQYDHDRLPQQIDNFITDVRADPSFANCTNLGELAIKMILLLVILLFHIL